MGYREGQPKCSVCNKLGDNTCPRCGRPFCAAHQPAEDQRCAECERELERGETIRLGLLMALALLIDLALVGAFFFGPPALLGSAAQQNGLLIVLGALAVCGGLIFGINSLIVWVHHSIGRGRRTRFLAEKAEAPAPAVDAPAT